MFQGIHMTDVSAEHPPDPVRKFYRFYLPFKLAILHPIKLAHVGLSSLLLYVERLEDGNFKLTKFAAVDLGEDIEYEVFLFGGTDGVELNCTVHRNTLLGTDTEMWNIPWTKDGSYKLQSGEMGKLIKFGGYSEEDKKMDDFLALIIGNFVLDLAEMLRLEVLDKEDMVEAVDEEWIVL